MPKRAAKPESGQSEKPAKRAKTKTIALTPDELEQQFQGVLLNLQSNRQISTNLYLELQTLLDDKLKVVYEVVQQLSLTTAHDLGFGSVNRVVSDIISTNREQNQLFQDMLAAKLFVSLTAGKKVPLDVKLAERFATKVDLLIKNLENLSRSLTHSLKLVHGKSTSFEQTKGFTLEHEKDLPNAYQAALQKECEKLLGALQKQIGMNVDLRNRLKPADLPADVLPKNKPKRP